MRREPAAEANAKDKLIRDAETILLRQTCQREDRHALKRDEQGFELLRRDLGPHRRAQGRDLFWRQMRVGALVGAWWTWKPSSTRCAICQKWL